MAPMVWNISTGQLGYLSGYAPSQLLHTCLLAAYEKLEKVLDFIATAENISYPRSSCTTPETQQLQGGNVTLSQSKPGYIHL